MRQSGILMPLSSLPSPYGIGTLGRSAYDFVNFLAQAGQALWQILPINPTGYGDSPYQSFSAFAGNPYFIDLDMLCEGGLLTADEIGTNWGENPAHVEYELLFNRRFAVLAKAAARQDKSAPAYRTFCQQNAYWLDNYAMYMAIKEAHGQAGFAHWPTPLRLRTPAALKAAKAQYAPRIEFWRCVQYFFFQQWAALKQYANSHGVGIVGYIPIYVSDDSSDLWANPQLFLLNEEHALAQVAGVPPDAFTEDGQLWGNPLYNWPAHKRTRYAWWQRRLKQAEELFDVTRIDHFRGFSTYYAVPAGSATARNGSWEDGPGIGFISMLHRHLPNMKIIAEDLGFLTADVYALLKASGYPGMKILQFAFDSREESDYLPHNYQNNTVVYTGTHDNTTSAAWLTEASPEDVQFAFRYLGIQNSEEFVPALIRAALASVANTAIIPLPDWLGLGAEARINTPSTLGAPNWCWRLTQDQLCPALAGTIRAATHTFGRIAKLI